MRSAFRRFRELRWRERLVLAQLIGLALIVRTLLFFRPLSLLDTRRFTPIGTDQCQPQRLARLCELAAAAGPRGGRCLVSSVLLFHLLKRRGEEAAFCLGIRTGDAHFPAHAWVERHGLPMDGTDIAEFAQLTRWS